MIISRRPNKRQSTDKDPGPRIATAAPMITTRTAGSGELNRFGVGFGNHDSAVHAVVTATNPPATGVRTPSNSKMPLNTTMSAMTQISNVETPRSVRYAAPWMTAVAPTAMRNNNNPTPGHPPGNVENSRCRSLSPSRPGRLGRIAPSLE